MKMKKNPLSLLVIAGSKGRVTRRYPFEEPLTTSEFRGKVEIDESKCIGCGACVNACPPNALELLSNSNGTKTLRYFIGRCIYCWRCIDVCPVGAIKGTKEFELATNDVNDLYELLTHEGARCNICNSPYATVRMVRYVATRSPSTEGYVTIDPKCRQEKFVKAIEMRFGGLSA